MKAAVGDRLVVKSGVVGHPGRDAEVLEVCGQQGDPPYRVRWSDTGHEGLYYPGGDAEVHHHGSTKAYHSR